MERSAFIVKVVDANYVKVASQLVTNVVAAVKVLDTPSSTKR